jgi:hypothetical protein
LGTAHCWEFEGPTAPTEGFSRRRTEGEQKEVCNRRRKTAFVPEVDDPEDAPKRPKRVFPLQHHCRRSRRSGKIRKQNSWEKMTSCRRFIDLGKYLGRFEDITDNK